MASSRPSSTLQDRFRGQVSRSVQKGGNLLGVEVTLTGGHHKGASRTVRALDFSIGGGEHDTIRPFADTLAPAHIKISRAHPMARKVRVSAHGGALTLGNGDYVEQHGFADMRLPASFSANGVSVRLNQNRQGHDLLQPLLALVVIAVVGWGLFDLMGSATRWNPLKNLPAAASRVARPLPDPRALENAANALSERIAQAGLTQRIQVAPGSEGTLIASGLIFSEEAPAWRQVLQWYDSQALPVSLINNVDKTGDQQAAPAIASVWFENGRADVHLSDRSNVKVGDSFGDGWIIEKVDWQGIELKRGEQNLTLSFDPQQVAHVAN